MKTKKIIYVLFAMFFVATISTNINAALTIPTEGVNDKVVDTKNSAGVLTERKYYYKSKLVEKRTYTSIASSDCRMRNKYLYYSDGSTLERHRTYSNTGATCYNLQTKTYRTTKTLNSVSIYEPKINGKVKESRHYDTTGTYYTEKRYYTNGIWKTREYWKGSAPNYITHIANMNSAGTEWQKATYYYNSAKDIKEISNHKGTTPNARVNSTGYRTDGTKEWYKQYNNSGQLYHMTYYDAKGTTKTMEKRIYPEEQTIEWQINYQANGVDRKSVTYRDEENIVTKTLSYHDGNNGVEWETLYNEEGQKKSAKKFEKGTTTVIEEVTFQNESKSDVRTYYNLDGQTTRKLRYFKDGSHLRWDINYVNNEKKSVRLYDNKNNYELKKTYEYTAMDKELEKGLEDKKQELLNMEGDNVVTYLNIFDNEAFAKYIVDYIESDTNNVFYLEDVKIINQIKIDNANELANQYSIMPTADDETIEDLEEVTDEAGKVLDYKETGATIENNEDFKDELTISEFDTINGIGFLTELDSLIIKNGVISGIPDEISNLKKLKELDLSNNAIVGVSIKLDEVVTLEKIDLSSNTLTTTEKYFTNLINLKSINLKNNPNILFITKDLIKHKQNNKLEKIYIDSNVNFKDTDIEDYEIFYNLDYLDVDRIEIDNTLTTKIYKEDNELKYIDVILPEFTDNIKKDLNKKKIGSGTIEVCYVNENSDYEINITNNDDLINLENINCKNIEKFSIDKDIDNSIFSNNGTYIVSINMNNNKLKINHTVIVRKYSATVEDELKKEGTESTDDLQAEDEKNIDLEDNEDMAVSQTELKQFSKEEDALSQLEDLEDQYNIVDMDGYAGAYMDNNKDIVIQFSNNNAQKLSRSARTLNSGNKIRFENVEKSFDELKDIAVLIGEEAGGINIKTAINAEANKIIIYVKEENKNVLIEKLSKSNVIDNGDYEIKVDNSIPSPTAKTQVNMGQSYRRGNQTYNYATFGYRVKYYKKVCVKKKNGKCKRDKKGKLIINKKKSKWIKGATVPNHDGMRIGTEYYKGKKYIGKKYRQSKYNDTDMIAFNLKKATPNKKVSWVGKYHAVGSSDKKAVVEGATVWKVYKSIRSSRMLVSGKITDSSCYFTGGPYDMIEAQISNTKGDSGGPLVLKYNKKKFIIGTSNSGVTEKNHPEYSGIYSYYIKSGNSKKSLGVVAY